MVVDHIEALNSTVTGTIVANSAIYTSDNLISFKTNNLILHHLKEMEYQNTKCVFLNYI